MTIKDRAIKWYQDRKIIIAFVVIVASFILGVYSKAIIIIKFYEPIYVITGLSLYTFSWILLFIGIFMVGWSTVKSMQARINNEVKSRVKSTYNHAKQLPGRASNYTKKLRKKGIDKISTTTKRIKNRINQ